VIQITCANRVWMQLNATEIHHPRKSSGIVDDNLLGLASGWK
jgi:hypothetical protein